VSSNKINIPAATTTNKKVHIPPAMLVNMSFTVLNYCLYSYVLTNHVLLVQHHVKLLL